MHSNDIARMKAKAELIQEQISDFRGRIVRAQRQPTKKEAQLLSELQAQYVELTTEINCTVPEDQTRLYARTVGGEMSRPVSSGPFSTFGEQMSAVMRAGLPGGQVDPRLYNAATGLSETVPSDGGFLVQQDFTAELLEAIQAEAPVASRCNRIPISSGANGVKLPGVDETSRADGSRWGGVRAYWMGEAEEKTASKPKFRKVELELKKLAALIYATDELLQDATALEMFLQQAASAELGFMLDAAILSGTGAGQPLGILNGGSLVTVSKEAGQAASTFVYENAVKMFARMPARSRKNAVWFINQAVEPQLFQMSLAVGTGGGPVYLPAGGASAAPYSSLFGRPVIPIEQCPNVGTLGDVLFADMSQYLLAEKGGIKSDVSIHVRFVYDESVFRFVLRVDGQPSWASALTPYSGGDTLSPFVALETRD